MTGTEGSGCCGRCCGPTCVSKCLCVVGSGGMADAAKAPGGSGGGSGSGGAVAGAAAAAAGAAAAAAPAGGGKALRTGGKSKMATMATMVGYDTNGDGRVDSLDTNGDGNIDALVLPANSRKRSRLELSKSMPIKMSAAVMLEVQGYDTNEDGSIDHLDTNGDGKIDSRIVPNAPSAQGGSSSQKRGHDGTLIAVGYDTNMDGRVDCLDTNGDGQIDAKVVPVGTGDNVSAATQSSAGKAASAQSSSQSKSKEASKVLLSAAVTLSIVGYDTNGDGKIDHLDTNGDGVIDSRIVPCSSSSEAGSEGDMPGSSAPAAAGSGKGPGGDGQKRVGRPREESASVKSEPREFEPSSKKSRRGGAGAGHDSGSLLAQDMRHASLSLPINEPGSANERMQSSRSQQPPNRVDSTGFWKVAWNEEFNSWYWWNTRTRETSWEDRVKVKTPVAAAEASSDSHQAAAAAAQVKREPAGSADAVPLRVIRNDADEGCDLYCVTDWFEYVFSLGVKQGHRPTVAMRMSSSDFDSLKRTMYAEQQVELITRRPPASNANSPPMIDYVRSGHMIMLVRESPDVPVTVRDKVVDVLLRDMARDRRRESECGRGDYRRQPSESNRSGGSSASQPAAWDMLTKYFDAKDEAGLKLNPEQLAAKLRHESFDPSGTLELEEPIVAGLTEMFRRKRPYLVTIARQLVCDEVRTADYNEAKQLGLLQQQRPTAIDGQHADVEDTGYGMLARGPKLPKVKCVEQINRLELERMHLAQQCDPEPPKLTTDDLLRISAACCLTLEETRAWFQNKNRGSVPGRARGKPKGTKDIRITLPPRLAEWKGMEIKTWQR
eukprot:SAG22_NODE_458_length_10257_cov_4.533373_4_plen_831_part_00